MSALIARACAHPRIRIMESTRLTAVQAHASDAAAKVTAQAVSMAAAAHLTPAGHPIDVQGEVAAEHSAMSLSSEPSAASSTSAASAHGEAHDLGAQGSDSGTSSNQRVIYILHLEHTPEESTATAAAAAAAAAPAGLQGDGTGVHGGEQKAAAAAVEQQELICDALVLATGGFAANRTLLRVRLRVGQFDFRSL